MSKPRIFSGIQPSGNLHIGNYLGAIKNWVKLQDKYDSIFCVVDMHAITVPQDPDQLRKNCLEAAKFLLVAGIDPQKATIFIQSHVSEHAELAWILNTITRMSDLSRMTQFKDKARRGIKKLKNLSGEVIKREVITQEEYFLHKTGVGLFDYPVLMAADILLYDTNLVPVGEDQLQHVEITRTLGKRFNNQFGQTFVLPEPYITKEGQRIMGLDDLTNKMSKSAQSDYNYIALTDTPDDIKRKIKKAVTDSGSEIVYRDNKPALKNLINIYSLFSDIPVKEVEKKYKGSGYAEFKNDLAEVIIKFLGPFQAKLKSFPDDKVLAILKDGAEKLRPIACKKLEEVKKKIGFLAR